ncbi:hypothetical protein BS47DRAFT_1300025, partial [Hydnum rufescens UP504]
CEHHSSTSRSHLYELLRDVDLSYFEALWNEDEESLKEIEAEANAEGWSPKSTCLHTCNASSTLTHCPVDHRLPSGKKSSLISLTCRCKIQIFTPRDLHACPFVVVVLHNHHSHPIPMPTHTPLSVIQILNDLLKGMGPDLPDATPLRFLRYPTVNATLRQLCPDINQPTIVDVHPSLANYEHLRTYIWRMKETYYPFGTDWEGKCQKSLIPNEITDFSLSYRIIVCMTSAMSRCLAGSLYVQSDIAFKRVKMWYEFEIAVWDRELKTSIIVARAFLTHQTARIHEVLFRLIDSVVHEDTGSFLQWRHLDSPSTTTHCWDMLLDGGFSRRTSIRYCTLLISLCPF